MDKSNTHVKVQKNGIEDWLPKNTWASIGGIDNKDGWVLVQADPPEAIEIRRKKTEEPQAEAEVPGVQEAKNETASEPVSVKDKAKKGKK